MLERNTVIEGIEGSGLEGLYRVILVSRPENLLGLFRLGTKLTKPLVLQLSTIEAKLSEHELFEREYKQPSYIYWADEELPEKWKEIRDKNWLTIKPIITTDLDNFILDNGRGRLLSKREIETGVDRKNIRTLVYTYLKFGMIKNALLPAMLIQAHVGLLESQVKRKEVDQTYIK